MNSRVVAIMAMQAKLKIRKPDPIVLTWKRVHLS